MRISAVSKRHAEGGVIPDPLALPRSPRYRSLDLWRGLACLLVVVYHATFYAAGRHQSGNVLAITARLWAGVPMFFVISGYCISATVDSTRRRPRPLRTYFARRLRRIYPPYWAVLALAVVLVASLEWLAVPGLFADGFHAIPRPEALGGWQWLGNLTLTESWRPLAGGGPLRFFLGHAWTLCYEEQFYAVSGLLLLCAPRRFFTAAAAVTGLTAAVLLGSRRLGWSVEGLFLDGRWLLFAFGILVYYRVNYAGRGLGWLLNGVLVLGIAWAAREPAGLLRAGPTFDLELFLAGCFALLLSLAHPWDGRLVSSPLARPLLFCGTICYSLYLVHWPVVKGISHGLALLGMGGDAATWLLTLPLCLSTAVAAGWAFHRAVEQHFLNAPQSETGARRKAACTEPNRAVLSTDSRVTRVPPRPQPAVVLAKGDGNR
jgi:peptidoglycan/LPS O-acetylase OafA/YrhL